MKPTNPHLLSMLILLDYSLKLEEKELYLEKALRKYAKRGRTLIKIGAHLCSRSSRVWDRMYYL